jgi:hypothetical protein
MTILPFGRNVVFEPETIRLLVGAYEELLDVLNLADRDPAFKEVVAREVIEAGRLGVRDAAQIRRRVLDLLQTSPVH